MNVTTVHSLTAANAIIDPSKTVLLKNRFVTLHCSEFLILHDGTVGRLLDVDHQRILIHESIPRTAHEPYSHCLMVLIASRLCSSFSLLRLFVFDLASMNDHLLSIMNIGSLKATNAVIDATTTYL